MGNKFNQIIDPNAGSIMDHFEGLEDRHRSGWDDMPEFVQQNKESFHRIVVRFNSEEDVREFGEKIGQPNLCSKNKYTWYPMKDKKVNLDNFFYEDEGEPLDN
tara:strand:+ start:814 stop:1122 length:309 start_codon:yes stop_codon:yes gene_type:complete